MSAIGLVAQRRCDGRTTLQLRPNRAHLLAAIAVLLIPLLSERLVRDQRHIKCKFVSTLLLTRKHFEI